MGTHDELRAGVRCTHCGAEAPDMVVEVLVGAGDLRTYQLGDPVVWRPRVSVDNGGRPDSGALDLEGYAECEKCGRSYAIDVRVRSDRFESASVRGPAFSLGCELGPKEEA
jgi:hypothetical protein